MLAGVATAATTFLVLGAAGEVILSNSGVGAVWGSPRELASWRERYDSLARGGNLLGFRSPYEQVAKPPGTFRIVTLGDSYTWGDKIALTEDTWPARLESILEAGARDVDIEVVNLAEAGFTTANEVELMSRLGWQFGPDLVLIQFLVNDAFPSWPGLGRVGSAEVFGSYRLLPARFAGAAAGRSALVAYLEKELNALLQDVDYEPLYEEDAEGWAQLQAAIRQLGRDAAERDVPVVMLLTPRFVAGAWTAESHRTGRSTSGWPARRPEQACASWT
jgi:lysophospholipase L1-like esterase